MFPAAGCNALNLANTNARPPCPQITLEAHARGGTLFTRGDIIHSDTVRHDRQLGNIVAHCMNCVHTSSLFSCDHTSQASPIAQELLLADKGGIATGTVLP